MDLHTVVNNYNFAMVCHLSERPVGKISVCLPGVKIAVGCRRKQIRFPKNSRQIWNRPRGKTRFELHWCVKYYSYAWFSLAKYVKTKDLEVWNSRTPLRNLEFPQSSLALTFKKLLIRFKFLISTPVSCICILVFPLGQKNKQKLCFNGNYL